MVTHWSVGTDKEDEELTTNNTDRKWIQGDVDDDGKYEFFDDCGEKEGEGKELWLRRMDLMKVFFSMNI